jgi:hypothetical protein
MNVQSIWSFLSKSASRKSDRTRNEATLIIYTENTFFLWCFCSGSFLNRRHISVIRHSKSDQSCRTECSSAFLYYLDCIIILHYSSALTIRFLQELYSVLSELVSTCFYCRSVFEMFPRDNTA